MAEKPIELGEWATDTAEIVEGGTNKVEPSDNLKANGTLDGFLGRQHFNWLQNIAYLWQKFLNDSQIVTDGNGVGLMQDDNISIVFAIDKLTPTNYVCGMGYKPGTAAGTMNVIASNVLGFGSPSAGGDLPIIGGTSGNIKAFSITMK